MKCNEGLDLLQYGIPYILNCPLDVTTQKIGQGSLYYVAIRNAKGYDLQVFMSPATTNNLSTLRQRKKTELLSNPQFVKIIEEYNEGFLYEKNLDGLSSSYDFIYFVVKGDNEINFQCGNSKAFSEQEVRSMLESVRN
ncbi:MAG: hypothetical protein R2774_05825 [Saprospiraceae bacterium]